MANNLTCCDRHLFADNRGLSLLCYLPSFPSLDLSVLSPNHCVSSGLVSNKLVKIDVWGQGERLPLQPRSVTPVINHRCADPNSSKCAFTFTQAYSTRRKTCTLEYLKTLNLSHNIFSACISSIGQLSQSHGGTQRGQILPVHHQCSYFSAPKLPNSTICDQTRVQQEEIDLKSNRSSLKSIKQMVSSLIPRHQVFYRMSTLESPQPSPNVQPTVSSLPTQKWPLIRLHLDTAALRKPNRKWNCDQCFKRDRKAEPWLRPRVKTLSSLQA